MNNARRKEIKNTKAVLDALLEQVVAIKADVELQGFLGRPGVDLHVIRDAFKERCSHVEK